MSSETAAIIRLFRYSSNYRRDIYLAVMYSILNKLFDLAPPVLIGAAVDIVVRGEGSVFSIIGITDPVNALYVLAVLTLFIWVMESLFEFLYKVKWRNLAQVIQHQLRMDAYNHIQNLEMEFFEDRQTGGLMAILNDDVNQLERFLDIGANDLIQVTTTVIAISISFFLLSPTIGAIALIPIPLIIIFSFRFQKYLEPRYAVVRQRVGILNGRLSNNLSGISTIKSYTNEDFESDRIEEVSLDYQEANKAAITVSSAFSPLIRMIIVMGFIGMLVVGGQLTLQGTLEVASYSVIIFLIQRLLWPLTTLGQTFDMYQRAMASTHRAMDLLDTQPKIVSGPVRLNGTNFNVGIKFVEVNFGYKTRSNILTDFTVDITPGHTIAFVGATGAGKSTIVKLLLRYYDIQSGEIRIDGHEIKDLNLTDLRGAIGLVSQDTFIIDGSVRENIIYGNPNASEEEIIAAASIAEIHSFIKSLPEGYETMVGERGRKLSGGQRQRLSIARAVLKNPPILIFDEATSSVDNETEAAIQRSLEKIIVGRTTIIIAHRLSTIRNADQIYVLDHGKIVEKGTHDDLVDYDGIYSNLWKVQTGERTPFIETGD